MKLLFLFSLFSLFLLPAVAESSPRTLPRSTPEAQGIASADVQAFIEAADSSIRDMHGFMLLRHGHVVAECMWAPFEANDPHMLYSLSKSFTSTAVGMAIAEGKLDLDEPVLKFFPEDAPASPSKNLQAMRLRDLLRMATGHQDEPKLAANTQAWTKTFLEQAVPHKPGTHFLYNTAATYMQSAIVQKVTGQTVLDYLRPRLFEPLGIENPSWGTSPQGVSLGGYGLSVRLEDIAKFGQLYLRKGRWGDRQLVPSAWVEEATSRQVANGSDPARDWDQGYGYQFWRCRHEAYRGDGAFGQYCLVMPEQDAVIAITSGVKDMQQPLDLIWDKLLPAMRAAPLPENPVANKALAERLAKLALPTVQHQVSSLKRDEIAGRRYVFPTNDQNFEAMTLTPGTRDHLMTLRVNGQDHQVRCGHLTWVRGARLPLGTEPKAAVAACGAWTAEDTFTAKFCFHETPYVRTLGVRFDGERAHVETLFNVGFGSSTTPVRFVGQMISETPQHLNLPPSDDGLPGSGPIRRYDWFQQLWTEKRTGWSKQMEHDQGAVVMLGDSITQGWGEDFSGHFPGMKIANRGISGDTSRGLLLRLKGDVIALGPKAVVLLIGTNDLEEKAEPSTIAANTKLILQELRAWDAAMPIVLCQVFPSSASAKRPANKILEINRLQAEAAKDVANLTLLETWPLFADENGDAKKEEFPDLLHPNEAGYTKWAAALRPVFDKLKLSRRAAP